VDEVYTSFFDAVNHRRFNRHLYRVSGEEVVYVWATQPLYAQNAALKHWGAIVSDPTTDEIAVLQAWYQSLTPAERQRVKALLNET
jgi:hypothetical protein